MDRHDLIESKLRGLIREAFYVGRASINKEGLDWIGKTFDDYDNKLHELLISYAEKRDPCESIGDDFNKLIIEATKKAHIDPDSFIGNSEITKKPDGSIQIRINYF